MPAIVRFVFSGFAENTYVVSDASGECVIVDPGCGEAAEQAELSAYIEREKLRPVHLLNTHCHIDHVLGNAFVTKKWQLPLTSHRDEQVVLDTAGPISTAYGISYEPSPPISVFLDAGDTVSFGETTLHVRFVPGHSPAHIVFYDKADGYVLCGDTIFAGSVGRTDLPGGNTETLMTSITEQLMTLPEDTRLLPGHMEETTVGEERANNPFLRAWREGKTF